MSRPDIAREEAERAAADAARIGGRPSSEGPPAAGDGPDEVDRAVVEAGGGESEGFEQAEAELIEHATHADQHAARRVIEDAPDELDDPRVDAAGEADFERSSEREENRGKAP
jgi:hypothetical protein